MFQNDPIFAPTASGSSGDTTPDQGSGAGNSLIGVGGGGRGMGLADAALRPGNVCRCFSEFALEFRTTREKVLQQNIRKQSSRERRKTRGKTILEARDYICTNRVYPHDSMIISSQSFGMRHLFIQNVICRIFLQLLVFTNTPPILYLQTEMFGGKPEEVSQLRNILSSSSQNSQTEMFGGKPEEVSQLRNILSSSYQNSLAASSPRDSRQQPQDATDAGRTYALRKNSQHQSGFATSNSAFQLGSNSASSNQSNSARVPNGSSETALPEWALSAQQRNNSAASLASSATGAPTNPQVKMTGWMNERRLHSGSVSNLAAAAGDKQGSSVNGAQQSGLRPKNTEATADENGVVS